LNNSITYDTISLLGEGTQRMSQKKIGGYIFRIYLVDHLPYHVHILKGSRELGQFDIENQRPMGSLVLTAPLRKALRKGGYLK